MRAAFALQSDLGVCTIERNAVLQASLTGGMPTIRRRLADLYDPPGHIADQRLTCPVGSVEFVRAWMRAIGVREPEPVYYPDALRFALHRVIRRTTFGQAAEGFWVKPLRTKAWAARVENACLAHPIDEPVWEAPVIPESDWLAEWRVYVVDGQVVGDGRYDDRPDDDLAFDRAAVQACGDAYAASGEASAGYALDVALWTKGLTVLVEVTDGWSIGYYKGSCRPADYARLLLARWHQLAGERRSASQHSPPACRPSPP